MTTRRTTDSPRKRATKPSTPAVVPALPAADPVEISPDARRGMIAEAAYLRAERRGFVPGYELEDWVAAESEVDALLEADNTRRPQ